ncbi:MAG: polyhydroxyalkanoate depolymerase [Bauldia sp.]
MSFYQFYEWQHAALTPWRAAAGAARAFLENPMNPVGRTPFGKGLAASLDVFERTTRRYGKPVFGIAETTVGGQKVAVNEAVVWERPFCRLIHFARELPKARRDPKLILVAPMSGHYATLLRGTVATFLPTHEVYITDWADARMVPPSAGRFDLDDYIDYLIAILETLGFDTHIVGVCQPAVPVLAATALMEAAGHPAAPLTMTLMGGPIDARINPTAVTRTASERGTDWFRRHAIMHVPFPHPGFGREVYPGFLQLSGFMAMNLDRHLDAHADYFRHLVRGDGDNADKHREFYDEYLAVMDLTAEFFLQTVETVFVRYDLPEGTMRHRGVPVEPARIKRAALLTVEGERDDISGVGQTEAAHRLCTGIPAERRAHYLQPAVGHYGVFNGSRFRAEVAPRMSDFIRSHRR